jgi:predicted O-methyltransferase YrrM
VSFAVAVVLILAARGSAAENRDDVRKNRQGVLDRLEKTQAGQRPYMFASDGMFLKMLVESTKAKRVLEIGTSNAYWSIWIGAGLEETGGRMWTIEIDAQRARAARENLQQAGLLGSVVTAIEGDAFKEIPKLEGKYDLISLRAWKPDYDEFFALVYPRLNEGGVIVAHNAIRQAGDMAEYLKIVTKHPELDTVFVNTTFDPAGFKKQMEDARGRDTFDGFAVSYKRVKK